MVGLLAGLAAASAWDVVLLAMYGSRFGVADPIFSRDIGFYVFTLPALSAGIGFLTTLTRLCLFLLIPLYWLRGDIVLGPRGLSIEPAAGMQAGDPVGGAVPPDRGSGCGWWRCPSSSIRPPGRWSAPATPTSTPSCPMFRKLEFRNLLRRVDELEAVLLAQRAHRARRTGRAGLA